MCVCVCETLIVCVLFWGFCEISTVKAHSSVCDDVD